MLEAARGPVATLKGAKDLGRDFSSLVVLRRQEKLEMRDCWGGGPGKYTNQAFSSDRP